MNPALTWRNKLRRRFYKPFNRIFRGRRYFVCRYFGADFLVSSHNVGGLEISAKIAEYAEIKNFIKSCVAIRPDAFIDIGANIGLYTCILLKNRLVPRAIAFEPDRHNRVHLRANLLINDEVDVVRLDDVVALAGKKLAIKIDIERYERKALAGMARTLRDNRGIAQIEVLEAREETIAMMADAGYTLTSEIPPNLAFRKD